MNGLSLSRESEGIQIQSKRRLPTLRWDNLANPIRFSLCPNLINKFQRIPKLLLRWVINRGKGYIQ